MNLWWTHWNGKPLRKPGSLLTNSVLLIQAGLSEEELSITLYHEILEAAAVGTMNPPESLMDFNEGDFERSAREAHIRWATLPRPI
jgi:hypothetical protein